MRTKSIPPLMGIPPDVRNVLEPLSHNVEVITGRRGGKIARMDPTTATTIELAQKINEIIDRLQE